MEFSIITQDKHGHCRVELADWNRFNEITTSEEVRRRAVCLQNGETEGPEAPRVCFNAFFPTGELKEELAVPSGLYLTRLKLPELTTPGMLWEQQVVQHKAELKIRLAFADIRQQVLCVVAECHPECAGLQENQERLAQTVGLELAGERGLWCDSEEACPYTFYFLTEAEVFDPTVASSHVPTNSLYNPEASEKERMSEKLRRQMEEAEAEALREAEEAEQKAIAEAQTHYHGLALSDIATRLISMLGEPEEGDRVNKLSTVARWMRYITDFKPLPLQLAIPRYGLSEADMRVLCVSACSAPKSHETPKELITMLDEMTASEVEREAEVESQEEDPLSEVGPVPPLPPVFRQFYDVAPPDFKQATLLILLPLLGTLGSRLRGEYLSKNVESPSFMVALEAPQASGKSFIDKVARYCLKAIMEMDEAESQREEAFEKQLKIVKLQGSKNTKQERQDMKEMVQNHQEALIRWLPATASITKLLKRMKNAEGLHLLGLSVEIDTVYKAFKRGFSNLSDLLRCAFDNAEYGQDYASETSFSGKVPIYYNTLYSGTPKAIARFYPDSEDGTMSRTLFVRLPDQFGKTMPIWRDFSAKEKSTVDYQLERLNSLCIQNGEVMPEHVMDMTFLNEELEKWLEKQRKQSVETNNRTRNTFYRRCAVVGFRAGMIAHFLYGEKSTSYVHSKVCQFATWIAEMMLREFMIRVNIENETTGNFFASAVYYDLPDEFTREELEKVLKSYKMKSPAKVVIYNWKSIGVINNNKQYGTTKFTKVKKA